MLRPALAVVPLATADAEPEPPPAPAEGAVDGPESSASLWSPTLKKVYRGLTLEGEGEP